MLIRKVTPKDLPAIRELEQQSETAAHWGEREYEALFSRDVPRRVTLIAADQDAQRTILGFAIASCGQEEWEIENVVVAKPQRRNGTGSALVRKILQEADQSGASAVFLEVRQSNSGARKLYEKLGFSEIGMREEYYANPTENALILKISIAVP